MLLLLNLYIKTLYFENSLNPELTDLISWAYKRQIWICLTFHSCLHLLSTSTCWLWQFVECAGVFNSPRHFKGELREPTLESNTLQQQSWIYWWFVEDLDLVFFQHFYISGCLVEGKKEFCLSPFQMCFVFLCSMKPNQAKESKFGTFELFLYSELSNGGQKVQNQPGSKHQQVFDYS